MMERFELELLGGTAERRYRRMRPEVEAMPWDRFDPSAYSEDVRLAGRLAWTGAAFQEHRTGAACALTLEALITARAPIDLVALASRFPLDELVHVELCARMAMALGGGTEILYEPSRSVHVPERDASPLRRAAELVVCTFAVGEALSIPLLRATWKAARHPLPRAILARIVRDEAAHGSFAWTFLDWAESTLSQDDRAHLAREAALAIREVEASWEAIAARPPSRDETGDALGFMRTDAYLALASRSLETRVLRPLAARGIDPRPHRGWAREVRSGG